MDDVFIKNNFVFFIKNWEISQWEEEHGLPSLIQPVAGKQVNWSQQNHDF